MQTPTEFFPSSTNANIHRQWLSSPPQLEICHWHDPINALLLPPPVFNKIVSATSATQHNYGLALAVEGKSTDPARTLDEILFHQNFSPVFLHSPDCESCSVHFWALFSLSVRHPRRHDRHILHMTLIFFLKCLHPLLCVSIVKRKLSYANFSQKPCRSPSTHACVRHAQFGSLILTIGCWAGFNQPQKGFIPILSHLLTVKCGSSSHLVVVTWAVQQPNQGTWLWCYSLFIQIWPQSYQVCYH